MMAWVDSLKYHYSVTFVQGAILAVKCAGNVKRASQTEHDVLGEHACPGTHNRGPVLVCQVARDPYFSVIDRNGNGWCPGTNRNETINVPFLVNNISHETSQFPKFLSGVAFQNLKKCPLLSYHRASRHLTQRRIDTKWVPGQITHCMPTNLWISFKPPYKKTSDVQAFNKHHPAIFTQTLHLLLIFQTHTSPVLRNYTFSVTTQLWWN